MKFMKLGFKPDTFKSGEDNIRYVASELPADFIVFVGEAKFYLHKFPLLSKSSLMQKLVTQSDANRDRIDISDIPGGAGAFEICAKFCYGMIVTLNAYNVIAARCAAEYLQMYDAVEKGNLIYKIEVFLNSCIFRSWKDSIIVLQLTRNFNAMSEELKIISRCLDSIAQKACIDTSKVDWSYTYNWKKLSSGNSWDSPRQSQAVPRDWWVEDLCDLSIDLYKRLVTAIRSTGNASPDVIGKALIAYTARRMPGFSKDIVHSSDTGKYKPLAEAIIRLLPCESGSVPCDFLLKLLRTAIFLQCGENEKKELMKKIGQQLSDASVSDLLIRSSPGAQTTYDVEIVQSLMVEFVAGDSRSDASGAIVAKLVDGYLAEIAKDPGLQVSMFVRLSETASCLPRQTHDGVYRAIDMFLKEHPGIGKSEKKRICRLMDCRKLSADASAHAVQNERLPLRVVVQVLFFEQVRQASMSGTNSPELSGSLKASLLEYGSSRTTTTNTEEEWDSMPTAEDLKALKGELASLRMRGEGKNSKTNGRNEAERAAAALKMKGSLGSKILSKLWSSISVNGDASSSDTSSPGSLTADDAKSGHPKSSRPSLS